MGRVRSDELTLGKKVRLKKESSVRKRGEKGRRVGTNAAVIKNEIKEGTGQ